MSPGSTLPTFPGPHDSMTEDQFIIKWIDGGREPQCVPDLRFPNGVDIILCPPTEPHCTVSLPYPAKRCGSYYVECRKCGTNLIVTTAGRIDDPRSITIPCQK